MSKWQWNGRPFVVVVHRVNDGSVYAELPVLEEGGLGTGSTINQAMDSLFDNLSQQCESLKGVLPTHSRLGVEWGLLRAIMEEVPDDQA